MQIAASYAALGMTDTACDMLNGTTMARARFKELGIKPPPCTKPAPPTNVVVLDPIPQVPITGPNYVTHDELAEHERRIIQRTTSK